jgi:hypothetical protein
MALSRISYQRSKNIESWVGFDMSRMQTRKRVLEAVTDTPQTANQIFEKTGINSVRLVLQELKIANKVECVRCKMATHPYFTTTLWFLADTKDVKLPQYRSERLEAVFEAVTHEAQTMKQIAEASGVKNPHYSLKKLTETRQIKCSIKQVHIPHSHTEVMVWYLPEV